MWYCHTCGAGTQSECLCGLTAEQRGARKAHMIEIYPEGDPTRYGWTPSIRASVLSIHGGGKGAILQLPTTTWSVTTKNGITLKVGDELEMTLFVHHDKAWVIHHSQAVAMKELVTSSFKINPDGMHYSTEWFTALTIRTDYKGGGLRSLHSSGGYITDPHNVLGHVKVGDQWQFVAEFPNSDVTKDQYVRIKSVEGIVTGPESALGGGKSEPTTKSTFETICRKAKEKIMKGNVYNGQVIRTSTVQAGEGVSAGKEVSEVLFTKNAFIATSPEQASLIVSSEAARQESLKDVNFADPVSPIEVKVQIIT